MERFLYCPKCHTQLQIGVVFNGESPAFECPACGSILQLFHSLNNKQRIKVDLELLQEEGAGILWQLAEVMPLRGGHFKFKLVPDKYYN